MALTVVKLTAGVTGTLPIANGGTNSTSTTFVNLATNITGTTPIANGGTAATTLAGAGLASTPAFLVTRTTSQTVVDNAKTKIEWDNEVYDTDSAFSSYKFTVPAGQAGKYFLYIAVDIGTSGSYGVLNPRAYLYKNGVSIYLFQGPNNAEGNDNYQVTGTIILDLAAADYMEIYGRNNNDTGTPYILGRSGDSPFEERTWFGGYKLIGT